MAVGAIVVIDLLDNVQTSVYIIATGELTDL